MVQVIQAHNVSHADLEARFGLQQTESEGFFTDWFDTLPEITDLEKQDLDRIKLHFLRLVKRPPLSEETVKLVVLSPLLNLAGFYDDPFYMRGEESIQISAEDEGEIIRGRIDILVIQEQFWLLVIESKRSSFSLLEAVPQALVYMLANPNQDKPTFGLVTNGSDFIFLKLAQENQPKYAMSDQFTLLKRESELYQVLSVLKNLSKSLS
ncbi:MULTISPECIES: type I restriction enzyme HsdR N-terminal domain-containing protein [unclassified Nostoc]|uniref:type I restriction enzyme HsdR N-terminal domain-containing protein n=1 Tax=unclassified Nostoc TaxID=2593658 RepID=UPI002AD3CB2B|nr:MULTISPECIES: type I restriction enzyme HsdR N-terminal domain-containing protein [unclassified Nostoc]MDZ8121732.1 type I restriction enzyme HsdR N-terminal domain-containing protein [Nostoc sp. CmiVER01]MDZ8225994.1 type I restriction enzyme HsdR N-terminal domain-containing protein [Nostoc sp. ChiVER01]